MLKSWDLFTTQILGFLISWVSQFLVHFYVIFSLWSVQKKKMNFFFIKKKRCDALLVSI